MASAASRSKKHGNDDAKQTEDPKRAKTGCKVVGLTGGIASGKSTVRGILTGLGAATVDADKLGHAAYAKGSDTLEKVRQAFGDKVITADGEVNRAVLGPIVFGSKAEMKKLTDITWPRIRELTLARIEELRKAGAKLVVVEAAVMVEAGWYDTYDEVWVVQVPTEVAKKRLMDRNGFDEAEAMKRISSQLPNEKRVAVADEVIDNTGDEEALRKRVEQLFAKATAD